MNPTHNLLHRSGYNPLAERQLTIMVLVLCFVFFVFTSYLGFSQEKIFSSPDETANHFFTKHFITTNTFSVPAEGSLDSLITPRSVVWQDDEYRPVSFIGLPLLYGIVGKVLGEWSIYFFEPFLASVAVFLFFYTFKKIFSPLIAAASTLLLCTQPVFVFYVMRPFWHNGLFVVLLIIAGALLYQCLTRPRWWWYLLCGLTLTAALSVRSSEVIWIAASLIALLIVAWKKIVWRYVPFLIIGVAIVALPFLYYQLQTYTSVSGNYSSHLVQTSSDQSQINQVLYAIGRVVLPFGIHPISFLNTFFHYSFVLMFPWFTIGLIGLIKHLKYRINVSSVIRGYGLWLLFLSIWLMAYYGSFVFTEYIDPNAVLIGNSYARYWLPLYILVLPFTVIGLSQIAHWAWHRKYQMCAAVFLLSVATIGLYQIVNDSYFGLLPMQATYYQPALEKRAFILENTPENAIILAGQADKIVWPQRQVVGFSGSALPLVVERQLVSLEQQSPIYYMTDSVDEVMLLNKKLAEDKLFFQLLDGRNDVYRLVSYGL